MGHSTNFPARFAAVRGHIHETDFDWHKERNPTDKKHVQANKNAFGKSMVTSSPFRMVRVDRIGNVAFKYDYMNRVADTSIQLSAAQKAFFVASRIALYGAAAYGAYKGYEHISEHGISMPTMADLPSLDTVTSYLDPRNYTLPGVDSIKTAAGKVLQFVYDNSDNVKNAQKEAFASSTKDAVEAAGDKLCNAKFPSPSRVSQEAIEGFNACSAQVSTVAGHVFEKAKEAYGNPQGLNTDGINENAQALQSFTNFVLCYGEGQAAKCIESVSHVAKAATDAIKAAFTTTPRARIFGF